MKKMKEWIREGLMNSYDVPHVELCKEDQLIPVLHRTTSAPVEGKLQFAKSKKGRRKVKHTPKQRGRKHQ